MTAPSAAAIATIERLVAFPTVDCGPGHVDQAHTPDKSIALDQAAQCERFLDRLIARLGAA